MKIESITFFALAYGGAGVGRLADGRVCFVPGVLPGESAEIRIAVEKKRFVSGEVVRITESSGHRISPVCPLYGKCPGCAYMHCDYETEISWKERQLKDFLVRSKLADEAVIKPAFASPEREFYRSKLVLHPGGDGYAGYYAADNETVFPVEKCFLAGRAINALLPLKSRENILLRYTEKDGAGKIEPCSGTVLTEKIPGAGEFEVAGEGFFQVNLPVAAELVRQVTSLVENSGVSEVLELYCGVGVFSIALAEKIPALRCTGIELNKKAISFAKSNALKHQVAARCRFLAQDAGSGLAKYRSRSDLLLLLDPPRGGVEKDTLAKIVNLGAKEIIYISCAADTLARDVKELISAGYRVKSSRVLDMFPNTAHFESLTVLEQIGHK